MILPRHFSNAIRLYAPDLRKLAIALDVVLDFPSLDRFAAPFHYVGTPDRQVVQHISYYSRRLASIAGPPPARRTCFPRTRLVLFCRVQAVTAEGVVATQTYRIKQSGAADRACEVAVHRGNVVEQAQINEGSGQCYGTLVVGDTVEGLHERLQGGQRLYRSHEGLSGILRGVASVRERDGDFDRYIAKSSLMKRRGPDEAENGS